MTSPVKVRKHFLCPYSKIQHLGTMFVLEQKLREGGNSLFLCTESTYFKNALLSFEKNYRNEYS